MCKEIKPISPKGKKPLKIVDKKGQWKTLEHVERFGEKPI